MHKAIFFDRDGTLIKTNISTRGTPISIKTKKEIKIYKFVKTILRILKKKYLIFQSLMSLLHQVHTHLIFSFVIFFLKFIKLN